MVSQTNEIPFASDTEIYVIILPLAEHTVNYQEN